MGIWDILSTSLFLEHLPKVTVGYDDIIMYANVLWMVPCYVSMINKLRLGRNDHLLSDRSWYSKNKERISEKDFWKKDPGTSPTLYISWVQSTVSVDGLSRLGVGPGGGGDVALTTDPTPVKVKRLDDWLRRFPEACPPSLIGWGATKLRGFPGGSCCLATALRPPARRAPSNTFTPVKRRLHRLTTSSAASALTSRARFTHEQHELSQVLLQVSVFLLEVSAGRSQRRKESLCCKSNLEPFTLGGQRSGALENK